uniref:CHAT domain-containing protein n=1 Tax=Trichocoleus desertorum TaxID=1481672 RepID=UPI0025B52E11|nr:CHAT domain-containing protein [Trichocoleus desertorum]
MDQQRMQAYLALIEQLLNCPQGKEGELLEAYTDLLDAGLLAAMEQVAASLKSQEGGNAEWLRGFAAQLAEAMGSKTIAPADPGAASQFLLEMLQLIVDKQGNPQQIYPVWAQQQSRFNVEMLEVLPSVASQILQGDTERYTFIARVLGEFGNLLCQFTLGVRWFNLEIAIAAYEQSLQVITREAMPFEWATSMMNLANAYYSRIRGDRAENIEIAIDAYQQSLQVRTRKTMPIEWAQSTINLATAYYSRIRGDRAENIEIAIDAYQQSLQVITHEAMPFEWATLMMNLATAYSDRIRGDQAENIEMAIDAYKQSLQVITHEAMPFEWATLMMNLATAYYSRIRGDRAENIEAAIGAYEQSLQVTTCEAMPFEWAQSTMNLATAYSNRIRGNQEENIEAAIAAYKRSLQVRTREAMPFEWATSMMNLANAYYSRIRGDQEENIEAAIAAYQDSLKIFTPELLPDYCRKTARTLGNLYFGKQRWEDAVSVYQKALQAAETLYQSANLLDGKAAELAETADLPRRTAYALARTGHLQQAVEILEQGRARGLSESLSRDRADLTQLEQTHLKLCQDYRAIANQLYDLENQQRDRLTSEDRHNLTPEKLRERAIVLRQQLTGVIQRIRQIPGYEEFLSVPTFTDLKKVLQDCPLVYFISTAAGSLALIVTPNTIHDVWLDAINETQLIDLLQTWFATYRPSQSNRQGWFDAIDTVTSQLWEPLMAPVIAHLKKHQFQQVTLIPTGYLNLLPLHAAWTEDTSTPIERRYALDDIHFTYAPNARSLTAARAIAQHASAESILAINNPRQDLPNSKREVEAAIATFPQFRSTVLAHEDATVEAVKAALAGVAIAHFSCHGTANLTDPLNSGLLMSDGLLTLRDIFALNLADQGGLRLAILSACETGLSGIENADEAVSLPTGLLQAGVAAVIASLWSVSDLSTMLLLTKFYDLWREQALPPDQALRQAQIWLRDTTNEEKIAEFKAFIPAFAGTRLSPTTAQELYNELAWEAKNECSFAHPFHWAAFNYTGV